MVIAAKTTIHIVAGPTAAGKSAAALEIARRERGVIINCDSQQIYAGLPILSAQPGAADRAAIPHRLYGTLHPNDVCSAGRYRELAGPVIEETIAAGQTPVICGGTGLYLKALIEGLSPVPDIPGSVREAVTARYARLGAEQFYAELKRRDPQMARRFHVRHKARIIRAMEVLEATGQSLAVWQQCAPLPPPAHWRFEIHKIMPGREKLYRSCNARFLRMVENGALEEAGTFDKRLQTGEVKEGVPLTKALGFAELRFYLHGTLTKDAAIERAQSVTRRYAKRQVTWFRNQL